MTDKKIDEEMRELEELRKQPNSEEFIEVDYLVKKYGITYKQAMFVTEYVVDLNQTQAAIRAGYSSSSAGVIGHEVLKKPYIQAALKECMEARSYRTAITSDMVLQQLWTIASTSASELTQMRTGACRNCWGEDHLYQFIDERELQDYVQECIEKDMPLPAHGGTGYQRDRAPHPECPQCSGEGISRMWVADTRRLTPQALMLFDGVKKTKDGIEIKTKDSLAALKLAGQHLGMFTNKVELTGKDGGPVKHEYSTQDYLDAEEKLNVALSSTRGGSK